MSPKKWWKKGPSSNLHGAEKWELARGRQEHSLCRSSNRQNRHRNGNTSNHMTMRGSRCRIIMGTSTPSKTRHEFSVLEVFI